MVIINIILIQNAGGYNADELRRRNYDVVIIKKKNNRKKVMIKYDRLWKFVEKKGISQYKLLQSGISHSTLMRLKKNQSVNVETIDKLCKILNCNINDIMEYIPEE